MIFMFRAFKKCIKKWGVPASFSRQRVVNLVCFQCSRAEKFELLFFKKSAYNFQKINLCYVNLWRFDDQNNILSWHASKTNQNERITRKIHCFVVTFACKKRHFEGILRLLGANKQTSTIELFFFFWYVIFRFKFDYFSK